MSAVKPPAVAFVIPCYNEQAGIQHTLTCLLTDITRLEKSKAISPGSYVTLVDDGSTDRTWNLIEKISCAHPKRFLLIVSFQTFAIAVIGEYVGKIYFEAKSALAISSSRKSALPPKRLMRAVDPKRFKPPQMAIRA